MYYVRIYGSPALSDMDKNLATRIRVSLQFTGLVSSGVEIEWRCPTHTDVVVASIRPYDSHDVIRPKRSCSYSSSICDGGFLSVDCSVAAALGGVRCWAPVPGEPHAWGGHDEARRETLVLSGILQQRSPARKDSSATWSGRPRRGRKSFVYIYYDHVLVAGRGNWPLRMMMNLGRIISFFRRFADRALLCMCTNGIGDPSMGHLSVVDRISCDESRKTSVFFDTPINK